MIRKKISSAVVQEISEELLREIEESAQSQNRKPAEVREEAIRKYLAAQTWQSLVVRAEERNRAKGIAEEDVPRLVEEYRRENQDRGRKRSASPPIQISWSPR
jgi:predicted transcriptional regulator